MWFETLSLSIIYIYVKKSKLCNIFLINYDIICNKNKSNIYHDKTDKKLNKTQSFILIIFIIWENFIKKVTLT